MTMTARRKRKRKRASSPPHENAGQAQCQLSEISLLDEPFDWSVSLGSSDQLGLAWLRRLHRNIDEASRAHLSNDDRAYPIVTNQLD